MRVISAMLLLGLHSLLAQGTAFTYQGRLDDTGNLANGLYDLQFSVFDAATGGTMLAGPLVLSSVGMTNGLFTVTLDFGSGVFTGPARWLEIGARTNGVSLFTTLSPRQQVTPTPYAITAENLNGVLNGSSLSGTYGNPIILNNPSDQFTGTFNGNGSGLGGVNAANLGGLGPGSFWQLGGNNPTAGQFLGSLNNQPLELHINGMRGLRLEPASFGAPNVIGGSPNNFIDPGVSGAFIGSGGATNYIGQVYSNHIAADFGVIGGGYQNTIQGSSSASFIGGGYQNTIQQFVIGSFIGAGDQNSVSVPRSFVGGGNNNSIQGSFADLPSFIEGGSANTIQNNCSQSVVTGGANNSIQTGSTQSIIGGGNNNVIQGSALQSIIGGGRNNLLKTNSNQSVIAGGSYNTIDANSPSSTIGGGAGNWIETNAANSTIAGGSGHVIGPGANNSVIGGGDIHQVFSAFSSIAGGFNNSIGPGAGGSFIGGGYSVAIATNSTLSVIGGGDWNVIQFNSDHSCIGGGGKNLIQSGTSSATISGGTNNVIGTNCAWSSIGGGYWNSIQALSGDSTIAGGALNVIQPNSTECTIGGGVDNIISGSYQNFSTANVIAGGGGNLAGPGNLYVVCQYASVGGGLQNNAEGSYSTIPGGYLNWSPGELSFAAGCRAKAVNNGAFVWADSQNADFNSSRNNQFAVRAGGGAYMEVSGSSGLNPAALEVNSTSGNGVALYALQNSSDATAVFVNDGSGDIIRGFSGATGGNLVFETLNTGTVIAYAFVTSSDRNVKAGFEPVEPRELLEKVVSLPITRWHYTNDVATPHLGPMAQDFYAAFHIGLDDKHIATVDEGGVALAAIQGLNQKLEEKLSAKDAELHELEQKNEALQNRLDHLEELVRSLSDKE